MLRMQRAEPPDGTLAAPNPRRLTGMQSRMTLRHEPKLRSFAGQSRATLRHRLSHRRNRPSSFRRPTARATQSQRRRLRPLPSPRRRCRCNDDRPRTDGRAAAVDADCCRAPATSRATATRASRPSSAEIGFASANAGSGLQQCLSGGLGERVRDRFLIAAIDEQIGGALVAHARFGPRLHALRGDLVLLGNVVEAVQARDFLDQVFLDAEYRSASVGGVTDQSPAPRLRPSFRGASGNPQRRRREICRAEHVLDALMTHANRRRAPDSARPFA